MPVMDGIEATRQILNYLSQQVERAGNLELVNMDLTHIVAITSYQVEQIRQQTIDVGMKDMFEKPISIESVHIMVWRHFFRYSEARID